MESDSPFGPRLLKFGIPLVAFSLVATILLSIFGDDLQPPRTTGASGFSRSALGHFAFIEVLEELGVPVELSRARSGDKVSARGTLLLAEPEAALEIEGAEPWEPSEVTFAEQLGPWTTILILPKREGWSDPRRPGFVREVTTMSPAEVEEVLEVVDPSIRWDVSRATSAAAAGEWRGEIAGIPQISNLQLVRRNGEITPLLACDLGVLVAEFRPDDSGPVIIVSDPDLIAHHSIDDGDNLAIAVEVITRHLAQGESLVVDEEFHGLGSTQGFWRRALSFPAVLIAVQCALLAALILWGALGRFGPPERARVGLEAGSRRLVDSTAELLRFGGHGGSAIRKYLRLSVEGACRRLHAPESGTLEERLVWLGEREHAGLTHRIAALAARVERVPTRGSEETIRELALAIERWRWEIIHGVRGNAAD